MALVLLRSVRAPQLRSARAPVQSSVPTSPLPYTCSANKPPLIPKYQRDIPLRIYLTPDYVKSALAKLRNTVRTNSIIPPPLPNEHPSPLSSMQNPYQKLFTPSDTVSREPVAPMQIFKKSKGTVPRPPARTTKSSLLGNLMHKVDIGAYNFMMEQEKEQERYSNARPSSTNGGHSGNATTRSNANVSRIGHPSSASGTVPVQSRKCDTNMNKRRDIPSLTSARSPGNYQSNRYNKQSSRPRNRNRAPARDAQRRSVSPKSRSPSPSPPVRVRKPHRSPTENLPSRLPSPEARQEPDLNRAHGQYQICRSKKAGKVQPVFAEKPKPNFPVPLAYAARQRVYNTPGVQKPIRKSTAIRKTTPPSSPKTPRGSDSESENVAVGNSPIRRISGPSVDGAKKREKGKLFKPPIVSQPLKRSLSNERQLIESSNTVHDKLRHERFVQKQPKICDNLANEESEDLITLRELHSASFEKSRVPTSSTHIEPIASAVKTGHQDSNCLTRNVLDAVIPPKSQPAKSGLQHEKPLPERLDRTKEDAQLEQEDRKPERSFARPIKKRRTNIINPECRVTGVTGVTVVGKQVKEVTDVTSLVGLNKTQQPKPKVTESPTSVTASPFGVEELDLHSRGKTGKAILNNISNVTDEKELSTKVPVENFVELGTSRTRSRSLRCLSFERRQQKNFKKLNYISDPREESRSTTPEPVQGGIVQLGPVGDTTQRNELPYCDWEITFVEQFH